VTQAQPRTLGSFLVEVCPQSVAAFQAALGLPIPGPVPPTFPLTWLAAAPLRRAFAAALGTTASVTLLHAGQSFRFHRPLVPAARYGLTLTLQGPDARGVVRLGAVVCTEADNVLCVELESELLLHQGAAAL
jgi:hypothetical protein